MRSPVNGTAPTSAPGRSTPPVAGRLRRLARRVALLAVAVGAGFLLAALFQGPAAADGTRSSSGDELRRQVGTLVEPVTRVTVAERPDRDRPRAVGTHHRRDDTPGGPPTGAIGGVVRARDALPSTGPRRPRRAARVSVPPPRVGTSVPAGATGHEELRPASVARAAHRPARRAHPPRPADDPPRPAAPDPLGLPGPVGSLTAGLVTPLPHVVGMVRALPIQPLVTALLRVVDAVLPPDLGAVIVPRAPRLITLPALGRAAVPVTDPVPAPALLPPSANPPLSPVRAAAAPSSAARPPTSGTEPAPFTAATGRPAARPGPVAAKNGLPGRPVTPADQDAAGVDEGSPPAPGLIRPADRPSYVDAKRPRDLVPLLIERRTPSVVARPG
ncbi:hypothetical protein ACLQ24_25335 [Micromonospora sp. DT4]|uniref:hypothetical protein n=1 Tax=Micromonospora sp. DT4 TaxID=3393438 RepID=UPI003CF36C72